MLQQISIYLLKVICISGLLFLYYHIALRNKRFHYYNRFYLLMAVIISIVLPLLKLEWFTLFSNSDQTIKLYKIIYGGGENEIMITGKAVIDWNKIALYAMGLISMISLAVLCIRIARIKFLKKKFTVQQFAEFNFINTNIASAPFTFLKDIFWREDINLEEETGKQILQHEITHIRQKHSWDKLFMQLVLCIYWLNPFFYLIKKELYLIHEFIADEEAVKHADADAFAKMLLTAQFGKFNFLPAQSIFYSSIKRRLTMLTTSKKPQFSYVRRLMVLPLTAALVCLFAFTVKNNNETDFEKTIAAKPFVLVVDAGHGGTDYGAVGNGLYEKDAVLKIAQKIKALSSQYNVDVILTRNSDEYMSVKKKSDFANAQNADAMISIHANAQPYKRTDSSGIEIYIAKESTQATANATLASAIMQTLEPNFKTPGVISSRKAGIYIMQNSAIPAALIECGYITNPNDAANFKDNAKIELMAKNILQGVAAYANSANDRTSVYQNVLSIDTTLPEINKKNDDVIKLDALGIKIDAGNALYVLDEKIISEAEMKKIDANTIKSINVLKDKSATDKYGDKGKNGVIEIITKKSVEVKSTSSNALYVLNGEIISEAEMKKIDPNTIESINVLKDKSATDKYGDKGKNGVVEISLKKPTIKSSDASSDAVLYVLNGEVVDKEKIDKLDKDTIESVNVLKDKPATDKYGDKGKNGVVEITLKKSSV